MTFTGMQKTKVAIIIGVKIESNCWYIAYGYFSTVTVVTPVEINTTKLIMPKHANPIAADRHVIY